MKNIIIRTFHAEDLIKVRDLIYETIDICYSNHYPPRAIAFFKECHCESKIMERSKTGVILIVGTKSNLYGTGSIVGNEIFGVFVRPKYHKLGHGRDIMDELENIARRNGYKETELSISLPSAEFYKKRGYIIIEDCNLDVGENQTLKYWKARKTLKQEKS
jgi:GNAT superfamily N-acetyltransferase